MSLLSLSRHNQKEEFPQPSLSFEAALEVRAVTTYTDIAVTESLRGLHNSNGYTLRSGNVATASYGISPNDDRVTASKPAQFTSSRTESAPDGQGATTELLDFTADITTTVFSRNIEKPSLAPNQTQTHSAAPVQAGDIQMNIDAIRRLVAEQYERGNDVQ